MVRPFPVNALSAKGTQSSILIPVLYSQAQTPQQRRANAAFARSEERKMGRPQTDLPGKKEKKEKAPISPFWVCMSPPIHRYVAFDLKWFRGDWLVADVVTLQTCSSLSSAAVSFSNSSA